jgi:hypothetical protein
MWLRHVMGVDWRDLPLHRLRGEMRGIESFRADRNADHPSPLPGRIVQHLADRFVPMIHIEQTSC